MSNKYKPHLIVLPEDDANREFVNGFLLEPRICQRKVHVLKPAGGWLKAVQSIASCSLAAMPERRLLVLVDFDDNFNDRFRFIKSKIPDEVKDRVFVLGAACEPEKLRKSLGKKLEEIGRQIAEECADGDGKFWDHPLVRHNQDEMNRLARAVREFLVDDKTSVD